MKEALVLIAKAPLEGMVKTRLAVVLNPAETTELYVSFLSDTFAIMSSVWRERETVSLVLCYSPEGEEESFEAVEREGSLMLAQRGNDFGERLFNCFKDLLESGFDSVVLIGSDSPTLPEEYVFEAFENLKDDNDVVFGPSEDGGYYLIAMRLLHEELFKEIPWSTSEVMEATVKQAEKARLNLIKLPVWYDVDTPEDLERLKLELAADREKARFTRKYLKKLERERKRKV